MNIAHFYNAAGVCRSANAYQGNNYHWNGTRGLTIGQMRSEMVRSGFFQRRFKPAFYKAWKARGVKHPRPRPLSQL